MMDYYTFYGYERIRYELKEQITFGKYKDSTFQYILLTNPDYCKWLITEIPNKIPNSVMKIFSKLLTDIVFPTEELECEFFNNIKFYTAVSKILDQKQPNYPGSWNIILEKQEYLCKKILIETPKLLQPDVLDAFNWFFRMELTDRDKALQAINGGNPLDSNLYLAISHSYTSTIRNVLKLKLELPNEIEIDHKMSVIDCFNNGKSLHFCNHFNNLDLVLKAYNRNKSSKSIITDLEIKDECSFFKEWLSYKKTYHSLSVFCDNTKQIISEKFTDMLNKALEVKKQYDIDCKNALKSVKKKYGYIPQTKSVVKSNT
jgi:hypothetical protein